MIATNHHWIPAKGEDALRSVFGRFVWIAVAFVFVFGFAVQWGVQSAELPRPTFELPSGLSDVLQPCESDREWVCVASSSDGKRLAAGVWEGMIYVSQDFGASWSSAGTTNRWRAISSSADGQHLVAVAEGRRIQLSYDAGKSWSQAESARAWSSVTSSADGKVLAATVADGRIYISTNFGANWSARATRGNWNVISSSLDGRFIAASAHQEYVHVSRDFGETWSPVYSLGGWTGLAVSGTGEVIAAAESRGHVHISQDGGSSWHMTDSNPDITLGVTRIWHGLASSASGELIAGVDTITLSNPFPDVANGYVLTSSNQGRKWEWYGPQRRWSAVAVSNDGRRLLAAVRGGRLYTLDRTTSRYTLMTLTNSGPVSFPGFATRIDAGSSGTEARSIEFEVTPDSPELFKVPPQIRPDGTLAFATGTRTGSTTISVIARARGRSTSNESVSSEPKTFTLLVQGNEFKATPWTSDASTGISRSATLWAWRIGKPATEQAVINGVSVKLATGPPFSAPGQFSLEGAVKFPDSFPGEPLGFEGGGSAVLSKSFADNGNPAVIRLEQLIPGRPYTLQVLGLGYPDLLGLRSTWSAGEAAVDIDEHVFGVYHGVRVSHDFVAKTNSYEVSVAPRGIGRWGFSGIALNSVPARAVIETADRRPIPRGNSFDFGTLPVGLRLRLGFVLRNEGVVPLKDLKLSIEGTHSDEFSVITAPTGPIAGEGNETLVVEFQPKSAASRKAVLRIESNDPEPLTLELIGTGLDEHGITVTEFPDQTIDEDHATGPIPLKLGESAPGREFTLAGVSSEPSLVPPGQIVFGGTGAIRRVTVTPARDRFGSAMIQLLASDGRQSIRGRFHLHVRPVNDPPRFTLPRGVVTPAGTDWIGRESPRRWQTVVSSHDGQRLVAAVSGGRIHTSTNAGVTWTERETARAWTSVASSSSGSRLAAAALDGPIVTSSDFGATWIERAGQRAWSGLASSADGLRMAAVVDGGQIHTSTNGGLTWTAHDRARLWRGIASSADGLKLAAIVPDAPIQLSTDGGETWSPRATSQAWTAIASSSDGSVLAASTWDGPIFISTNAGTTWTARGSDHFWRTISCSADGSRIVAGESLGGLHVSHDSGATWTRRGVDQDWISVAWSGDGEQVAGAAFGGRILTSATRMAPHRLSADARAGAVTLPGFVRGISAGPNDEVNQRVRWTLTCSEPDFFASAPTISANGSLSFVPKGKNGLAHLTLVAHDDGGTDRGGADTSESQQFEIELLAP